jgi:outer membrane protein assembly factor BamA
MLLDVVGSRFLGLPFTLGLSVFHRLTSYNVASIVPNTGDLVRLLRQRSTGMRLSGAYPVTSKIRAGLSSQFERLALSGNLSDEGSGAQTSVQNRTEIAPSLSIDSATGIGPGTRGARFSFVNSWGGSTFLRTIDSTAQSLRFSRYINDPFTNGRNSFAFRFQGAVTRPRNNLPLTLDRRFYPGDEIARGFKRGSLSPWAYLTDAQASPTPAGADTVLAFSTEYRIPIQGPLSAAVFVDLGWSSLSKRNADSNNGLRLINETNKLLRASVGGELRMQLPIIHLPGRLIFSWNPLRLDRLIQGFSSPLRLADPRGSIHFALGDLF